MIWGGLHSLVVFTSSLTVQILSSVDRQWTELNPKNWFAQLFVYIFEQ